MSRDLSRLFRPRHIAIFGGGWAENVVTQCNKMGFAGEVWPVHPARDVIAGVATYRNLSDLPQAPDAVFLGVNRHSSVEIVLELAAMGAGGVICFASGFTETGDAGLQAELVAAAGDMPLLGPNCYGFINYLDGALLWPDQHGGQRVERGIALISQSSNIVINLTMQARGLPVAYVACVGNAAQTGLAAIAEGLLDDPRVTAIGFYIEGIGDAAAFCAMAKRARALGKPLVAVKSGKSLMAQAAAASHTASLAGGGAASSAFLAACGVAEVDELDVMLETLKLLHMFGPLPGCRLASLSCSGGEAGLVADLARDLALDLSQPETALALRDILGPLPTISNPLDYHTFIWGDAVRMQATYAAMMKGGYDAAMLVIDFPHATRCSVQAWEPAVDAWVAAAQDTGLPAIVVATLPENLTEDRAAALMKAQIAPVLGLGVALKAIAASAAIGRQARADAWRPVAPLPAVPLRMVDEAGAKAILARAGVKVPQGIVVRDCAFGAAAALRGQLALKGLGLAHKSEAGAVRLGLLHAQLAGAAREMPGQLFLVEEMVEAAVAELLVGLRRDAVYGATLTLGMGGTAAELLGDTQTLILPCTRDDMGAALGRLRLAPLLQGYRGRPLADIEAALDAVQAMADLLLNDLRIEEIEVNPLMLRAQGEGAVAADAVIWTRQEAT
ncbi:MAG: acetate--CoA ligase family protein [Paracoccaceae bacterium]